MSSSCPTVIHLTPAQLAKRWCVTERTLERWRRLGIGPAYIRLPGRVRYRLEDVEAYERRYLCCSTSQRVHPPEVVRA